MTRSIIVARPNIGDKLTCPGCGELLTLDWADGWRNANGLTCSPTNTTHTDHITTIGPIGAAK